jgi:hypothetical protein
MRRRSGVIDAAGLAAIGYDRNAVARLVAREVLRRRHRAVYVDGLAPLTPRGELFAATLALGHETFLSHRTALAIHGVRALDVRRIELTVVSGHTPRLRGLFVHRTSSQPPPDEVRVLDGLRVASPARAIVECARIETDTELDRLIAQMARRRLLDLERIDRAIARRTGVGGIVRLRAALARYRPSNVDQDASGLEREFAAWLATHPEIPPPQRNVRVGPWEFDFFWPDHGVVLETDGDPYHTISPDVERDRLKDAWVQRRKMAILRVTEFRFAHDRPGVRSDLLAMLDLHSARS